MKIVTWNVNSIRVRCESVVEYLKQHQPHIVLLQETKCEIHEFPQQSFSDIGYNIALNVEKSRNGVAILSKMPIEDVHKDLGDQHARYIECFTGGLRVASVYVPNGESLESEKYPYKIDFFKRLRNRLEVLIQNDEKTVIGGDFNVALRDQDVYDPHVWKNCILVSPPERQGLNALLNLGYTDAHRMTSPYTNDNGPFTFWSYRGRDLTANQGLRIDYIFLSPLALSSHKNTYVDTKPRTKDKASDHAPVICELDMAS